MKKVLDKLFAFIVMLLWVLAGMGGLVNCVMLKHIGDKIDDNHDTTYVFRYMPSDTVYVYRYVER